MIQKYAHGINYSAAKDEQQKDFGSIVACIGTLQMEAKHLESNLTALLQDVNSMRPKREGRFVTRVLLKSPPSGENLKINPFLYIPEEGVFSKRSAKTTGRGRRRGGGRGAGGRAAECGVRRALSGV